MEQTKIIEEMSENFPNLMLDKLTDLRSKSQTRITSQSAKNQSQMLKAARKRGSIIHNVDFRNAELVISSLKTKF